MTERHPNCCPTLVTAVDWTLDNGQNPEALKGFLAMPESTAIRLCLRRWGTTAVGYDEVLTSSGWYGLDDDPQDGDLAVIDGRSIVALNRAVHLPRDIIQLLAFRVQDDWQICTEMGMSPINWDESEAIVWRMYRCL